MSDHQAPYNRGGGGGGWHKALVFGCVPLAAPIGLSPPLILTLCGPERVLVVSTEPPDDLSCLTTPGVGRPGDGAVPVPLDTVGGGGVCTGIFRIEKISTRVCFACSPEFAVGHFAPTCFEPAFGKARLAISQSFSVRFSLFLWEFRNKCVWFLPGCYPCLFSTVPRLQRLRRVAKATVQQAILLNFNTMSSRTAAGKLCGKFRMNLKREISHGEKSRREPPPPKSRREPPPPQVPSRPPPPPPPLYHTHVKWERPQDARLGVTVWPCAGTQQMCRTWGPL